MHTGRKLIFPLPQIGFANNNIESYLLIYILISLSPSLHGGSMGKERDSDVAEGNLLPTCQSEVAAVNHFVDWNPFPFLAHLQVIYTFDCVHTHTHIYKRIYFFIYSFESCFNRTQKFYHFKNYFNTLEYFWNYFNTTEGVVFATHFFLRRHGSL